MIFITMRFMNEVKRKNFKRNVVKEISDKIRRELKMLMRANFVFQLKHFILLQRI